MWNKIAWSVVKIKDKMTLKFGDQWDSTRTEKQSCFTSHKYKEDIAQKNWPAS